MQSQHSKSESQFNMGLAYLKRIDLQFNMCWKASQLYDIHNWLSSLRAIERELSVKMDDIELGETNKKFKEINSIINKGIVNSKKNQIFSLLHNLEIKLRRIAQEKGMLLPAKRDISQASLDY